MPLDIQISKDSSESLHVQIAESIRSKVLDGLLKPGQRLPTIRDLAKQLGVHRLTIFKAYEELRNAKLIETRVGSGTFVATEFSRRAATDLLGRLVTFGPMNRFEAVSEEAGIRSLASNVPDPWLFRSDEFLFECYELRKASPWIFYYAPPAGAHELCRVLAEQLTRRGLPTSESQIIITTGNTHSMTLALSQLNESRSPIAIEDPMFLGAKVWIEQRGYSYRPIPRTEKGLDLDALRFAIKHEGCRVLALSPSFGQVAGWQMEMEERQRLVELCRELGCIIFELTSTSLLSYDQEPMPPLASLCEADDCVLIDDFSSTLSPGLRMGYLRLSREQTQRLESKLQNEQYSGVQFMQIALANYIERGLFKGHLERVIPKYRARRDRMMSALRTHMPDGVKWTKNRGAYSTWLELPEGAQCSGLYRAALDRGVAIAPGDLFTDRAEADRFMRLSFGTQDPPAIEEAVRILGEVIAGCL